MMKKALTVMMAGFLITCCLLLSAGPSGAAPGIIQLATRSGFWGNDFPDGPLFLQHVYYYSFDEVWDNKGKDIDIPDSSVTATFSRLIGVSHFGADNQYQYVIEAILPYYNFSMEESSSSANDSLHESGFGHPFFYNSIGWNNPAKTTHLTAYLAAQIPVGNSDVMDIMGNNSWALLPGVSIQQRFGTFQIEGSLAYWYNFEDLDSDARGNDYFEANIIATKKFAATYPWWIYLQGDYTNYQESDDDEGHGLNDDGYNWTVAPGIGVAIRPNITLDLKYAIDVDGESTTKGQAFNFRVLWKF
jgi:hypothetical protein